MRSRRMSRFSVRAGLVFAGACVAWLGIEARAHACTCLEGLSELVAPAIAEHPAGASFVFESQCLTGIDRWSATVDGVPVTLVGTGPDWGLASMTLASAAPEGAEVVLTNACGEHTDEADCVDGYLERITTTIGPADVVAPPPVAALSVDHEIGMLAERCGDPEVHAMRITTTLEIGDREPGTWVVVDAVVDGDVIASEDLVLGDLTTLQSSLFVPDPDEYAGRDVCVDVRVVDASSNASAANRECTTVEAASSGCAIAGRPHAPALLLLVFLWRSRTAASRRRR